MDFQALLAGITSNPSLQDAAANVGVQPDQAQAMMHGVLDHVSTNGDLEGVAEAVAGRVGVSPAQVQQFLPVILGLLQNHAATAAPGQQAGLGGLLGSLQGGPMAGLLGSFDANQNGSVADEALGLAEGLFQKR